MSIHACAEIRLVEQDRITGAAGSIGLSLAR